MFGLLFADKVPGEGNVFVVRVGFAQGWGIGKALAGKVPRPLTQREKRKKEELVVAVRTVMPNQ